MVIIVHNLIGKNGNSGFKVRRCNIYSQTPFEARDKTLFHLIQLIWISVASQDNLFIIIVKDIESIEKFLLSGLRRLFSQRLYIIN